jgi:hypothetical protein
MSEEVKAEKSIVDELNKMGQQVADAIKAAWESDDRKKLQNEITEGLQKFGDQVTDAAKKASESDAARQMREQAEKVVAEVRESNVTEDIRKGLLNGLEALNRELGKLLEKLENKTPPAPPPAPEAPEAPEAPKEG